MLIATEFLGCLDGAVVERHVLRVPERRVGIEFEQTVLHLDALAVPQRILPAEHRIPDHDVA